MDKLGINGGRPVRDNFLVFGKPHITEKDIEEVVDTLKTGWIGFGPKSIKFENLFKEYIGTKNAVSVSSCTAALDLSLKLYGIKEGDEVITTPLTFASTANVIVHNKATPIFVDVIKETQNIDPRKIEEAITPKTKAVIPVHLAGRPCDIKQIVEICEKHGLKIIWDCAHAIEAEYSGKKVGSYENICAFSFYPTKNITTCEGGMITTNDDEIARKAEVYRLQGMSRDAWKRYSEEGFKPYDVIMPGFKYNITDLQAALGINQLIEIEEKWKVRDKIFKKYNEEFSKLDSVMTPVEVEEKNKHARHLYTLLLKIENLSATRNEICAALQAENIGSGIHFIGLNLTKYYKENHKFKNLPNAGYISERTLSLPLASNLTEKDTDDVIEAVKKVIKHYERK
ncbi:DegT/DnrJ/EryC1/StrS family aminotransferase [Candidatus Woesearchaeota archaeon]|nr:DegT/DnrJ/EryC1/StrS family aminotransferase [Candidatus Woesearchaeota archaeon]